MLEITNGNIKVKMQYSKTVTAITCIMKLAELPSDIGLNPVSYRKFMGKWYVVQHILLPNAFLGKIFADELEYSWKSQFFPPEEQKWNHIHNQLRAWVMNCLLEFKVSEYGKERCAESQYAVSAN